MALFARRVRALKNYLKSGEGYLSWRNDSLRSWASHVKAGSLK